jgi:hypothetical protein
MDGVGDVLRPRGGTSAQESVSRVYHINVVLLTVVQPPQYYAYLDCLEMVCAVVLGYRWWFSLAVGPYSQVYFDRSRDLCQAGLQQHEDWARQHAYCRWHCY